VKQKMSNIVSASPFKQNVLQNEEFVIIVTIQV